MLLKGGFGGEFETEGESMSADSAASEQFPETLHEANENQWNNCDKMALYYKILPNL
jgi:hypothetical protein